MVSEKKAFLLKVTISVVVIGLCYIQLLLTIVASVYKHICPEELTYEHTYPHDKTIYVFNTGCITDSDSKIYVREGVLPFMREIGFSRGGSFSEKASSYIEQKGDILLFEDINIAKYHLVTGKATY
jgi:hypothetical protein